MRGQSTWTAERIAVLTKRAAEGATAAAIATELGGITESGVLKKTSRLRVKDKLPAPSSSSWTDDRVELLKKLWADGLSAGQIAGEIGITRNAAMGKIHRLKLAKRERVKTAPQEHKRAAPKRPKHNPENNKRVHHLLQRDSDPGLADSLATPLIDDLNIPEAQRRSILDLTIDTCRWPVGDPAAPGFFFCGAHAPHGPYCTGHSLVAFRRTTVPLQPEMAQ